MNKSSKFQNRLGPVVPMIQSQSPNRAPMRPNDLHLAPAPHSDRPNSGAWPRGEVIREGFVPARQFPSWRGRRGYHRGNNFRFSKSRCNSVQQLNNPAGGRYGGSVECLNFGNLHDSQHYHQNRRNRYDSFVSYTYHPWADEYIDDTLITDLDQYRLKEDMDFIPQIKQVMLPLPKAQMGSNRSFGNGADLKNSTAATLTSSATTSPQSEMPVSSNSTDDPVEIPEIPIDECPNDKPGSVRTGNMADYLTLVWDDL